MQDDEADLLLFREPLLLKAQLAQLLAAAALHVAQVVRVVDDTTGVRVFEINLKAMARDLVFHGAHH
ncbi:hypothetical protein [Leptolyngbya sp. FACHB-671]|uniref:hypothetical protein n=1 Tax=Leptolyngbya sp. FACHB-671 TaxID=2692812 RepID=UPI001685D4F8|nr:hypothetical protein [Leptolyngbya sp. FACHB-671]